MIIVNDSYGWDQTAHEIDNIIQRKFQARRQPVPVFCDGSYQTASEMHFYLKEPVMVFTTREARHSQFDYLLLANIKKFDRNAGILVLSKSLPTKAIQYFKNISFVKSISIRHLKYEVRRFDVYYFQSLDASALYKTALYKPLAYPATYRD
jgi:hypothetical protein